MPRCVQKHACAHFGGRTVPSCRERQVSAVCRSARRHTEFTAVRIPNIPGHEDTSVGRGPSPRDVPWVGNLQIRSNVILFWPVNPEDRGNEGFRKSTQICARLQGITMVCMATTVRPSDQISGSDSLRNIMCPQYREEDVTDVLQWCAVPKIAIILMQQSHFRCNERAVPVSLC
jgi:hypothetical protein